MSPEKGKAPVTVRRQVGRLAKPKSTTIPAAGTPGQRLLRYFAENNDAGNMLRKYSAAGCDLRVIVSHLENYLLSGPFHLGGLNLHEERRKRRDRTNADLKCAIKGLAAAVRFYRDFGGQLADAERMETEKARLERYLVRMKKTNPFDTKKLGALNARELPGELIVLAELEDYIAKCTGTRHPKELAWLVEAALASIDRLPDSGVDPEILAKRLKEFRERNPNLPRLRSRL